MEGKRKDEYLVRGSTGEEERRPAAPEGNFRVSSSVSTSLTSSFVSSFRG